MSDPGVRECPKNCAIVAGFNQDFRISWWRHRAISHHSTGEIERKPMNIMQISIKRKITTALSLVIFALGIFALPQRIQALSPPPDGGYAGGNTAEGQSALLSLTTGTSNTAVGIYSLLSLNTGILCTGVGAGTLLVDT